MWFHTFQGPRKTYNKLVSGEGDEENGINSRPFHPKQDAHQIFLKLSFLASILLNLGLLWKYWYTNLDRICSSHIVSHHSPILDDIDITFRRTTFFPGFYKQSVFQQRAGPEVDNAWLSLGIQYAEMILPEDKAIAAGLKGRLRLSDSEGGGYLALVEVLHHLHCLDLVRQALWWNYPYYREKGKFDFSIDDENLRIHVFHCLDTIRQQLMCNADYGVLGMVHIKDYTPFIDFGTEHTCRNFDDIREWAKAHRRNKVFNTSDFPYREGDIMLDELP